MKKYIIGIQLLLVTFPSITLSFSDTVSTDYPFLYKIETNCRVNLEPITGIYSYNYFILNDISNKGDIWIVQIDISRYITSKDLDTVGLRFHDSFTEQQFKMRIQSLWNKVVPVSAARFPNNRWDAGISNNLSIHMGLFKPMPKPGENVSGIELTSKGLPGIRRLVIEPWFDIFKYFPSMDDTSESAQEPFSLEKGDSIRNMVNYYGWTIGPYAPPAIFNPNTILDTLTNYTTQSRALGWIKDQATANKYLGYFATAKTKIQQSDTLAAKTELRKVLSNVDIDSTANITSEAYALLRYNTEYLVKNLLEPEVSGTILRDTTWSGIVYVVGDVTVNTGVTLTLSPGAQLRFASAKKLIINGSISINSTSSNRVTFDRIDATSTWGGIQFNAGSKGNVQYCNIYRASTGIYFNGNSIHNLSNNIISNCTAEGIKLYNASAANSLISYNTITNNGQYGIYCYASSPMLYNNTIKNNNIGVCFAYYSSSILGSPATPPSKGSNIITNNSVGILAATNSTPLIGLNVSGTIIGGYNCIHNNSGQDFIAMYCGTISAQNNWWNGTPKIVQSNSTVNYTPALSSDPNGCSPQMQQSLSVQNSITALPTAAIETEESQMLLLSLKGKHTEAIAGFKQLYKKATDKEAKKNILNQLSDCYRRAEKDGFIDYLNKEIRPGLSNTDELYAMTLELENIFLIQDGKYNKAVDNFKTLATKYSKNADVHKHALFNLGYLYTMQLNDKAQGKKYFDELKAKYPEDDLTQQSKMLMSKQ